MTVFPTPVSEIQAMFSGLSRLSLEDVLELEPFPMSQEDGDAEIIACREFLRIDGNELPHEILYQTVISDYLRLFEAATFIAAPELPFITALRIHYAITSDNEMNVFFQPLKLTQKADSGGEREYDVNEGPLFAYDGDSFEEVEDDNGEFKLYRETIRIKHAGDNDFSPWRPGDAKSATFSFQEIYTLALQNEPVTEVDIYNCVRQTVDGGVLVNVQHCIILSPDLPVPLMSFKGRYANHGHLCPPDCLTMQFKLAST